MNSVQPTSGQGSSTEKSELTGHLDSIARAIFIIWTGTAMLVAMPWGLDRYSHVSGDALGVVSRGPRHSHPGRAACSLADEHQD